MLDFFKATISPGMLPFTILLGIVLLYWIATIVGALDIEIFDSLLPDVDADVGVEMDADVDVDVDADAGLGDGASDLNGVGHILDYLNVGHVPVSIIGSVFVLYLWLFVMLFTQYLLPTFGTVVPYSLTMILATCVLGLGALVVTGASVRPMRKMFTNKTTHGHEHLVGKICKVKTTQVTDTVGQALFEEEGVSLTLSVRCPAPNTLRRGSDAVLVHYHADRDIYDIRPMT